MRKNLEIYLGKPRRTAFTLLELLVVLAVIGVLASLLLPAVARSRAKARHLACLSQLRQLGMSVRTYAEDHDQCLPAAELLPSVPARPDAPLPRICDVLGPLVGQASPTAARAGVFQCPADAAGRFAREGSSYEWNTELNGRRIDETRQQDLRFITTTIVNGAVVSHSDQTNLLRFPPVTTPLLLDYEDFHPRPPNSGKNVVFMDGHAAALRLEDLLPKPE